MPPENEENTGTVATPEPEVIEVPLTPEPADDAPAGEPGPSRTERRAARGRAIQEAEQERQRAAQLERDLASERERAARLEGRFDQLERALEGAGRQPEEPREIAEIDQALELRRSQMRALGAEYRALRGDAAAQQAFLAKHSDEYQTLEREAIRLEGRRGAVEYQLSQPRPQQQEQRSPGLELLQVHYSDVLGSDVGKKEIQKYIANWRIDNPGKRVGPEQARLAGEAGRRAIGGRGPGSRATPTAAEKQRLAGVGRSAGGGGGGPETVSIARTPENIKAARAVMPGAASDDEALANLARKRALGAKHLGRST